MVRNLNKFICIERHDFNESSRFLIFERKGIKTDLFAIERYVEEVLEEVISKFSS